MGLLLRLCTQIDLLHVLQVKASTANVEPDQTLEISEQEILERKQENVKAILQAYRFTGMIFFWPVSVWVSSLVR